MKRMEWYLVMVSLCYLVGVAIMYWELPKGEELPFFIAQVIWFLFVVAPFFSLRLRRFLKDRNVS